VYNTTGFALTGFRVTKELGTVRGLVVRSRSVVGNIGASLQTLFGGDITLYSELCEHARQLQEIPFLYIFGGCLVCERLRTTQLFDCH